MPKLPRIGVEAQIKYIVFQNLVIQQMDRSIRLGLVIDQKLVNLYMESSMRLGLVSDH